MSSFVQGIADASSASGQLGQVWKQSSLGLGSEFMKMQNDLRSAGFTLKDYENVIAKSNGALDNFGGTAKQRADALSASGKQLQDMADRSVLRLNMGQEELGKVLVLSQMGRKDSLATGEQQQAAANSAKHLAETISEVSARTGKSRDVIEAEMAERLSSAEVSAKLRVANETQREAIIETQAQLSGMGKTAADTATTIQNGGRLTNEQIGSLMAMGPRAANEFMRANRLIAQGRTEEGNELLKKAEIDKAAYQGTKSFANLLNQAPDQYKGYLKRSVEEDREAGGVRYAQQQGLGTGLTPEQLENQRRQQAREVGVNSRLENGQINPNVAPTNIAAGINATAFERTNTALKVTNEVLSEIAGSTPAITAVKGALKDVFGKDGELERDAKRIRDALTGIIPPQSNASGANSGGQTGRIPPAPTTTAPVTPAPTPAPTPTPTPSEPPPNVSSGGRIPPISGTRASGGPVDASKLYMVGENGPELFKSSIPGDIISNDKLSSMFGDIKTKISSSIPKLDFSKTPGLNADSIEQARQEAIKATSPVANTATTTATNPLLAGATSGEVTLKDIYTSLQQLNKTMGQVASHSETISQHSEKTARMSAKATGNRTFA